MKDRSVECGPATYVQCEFRHPATKTQDPREVHDHDRDITGKDTIPFSEGRETQLYYGTGKTGVPGEKTAARAQMGQRIVTHVPVGFCTKFGYLHPELRIFMNFSWVIVMHHFVSCSNVYLKIIVKYEDDHHIRDPLTRDLDFPIFFLIDFKF